MPDLDVLWRRYRDQGVLVYGVQSGESASLVAAFVEQTGITFPVVSGGGTLRLFDFPPGVSYPYPRDIVIGKDLRVRSIRNSFNVQEMDALVQQLLAE